MGTVWRAEDELLGRQVAVKKLRVPPQLHDDERERLYERTRREARSAARIAHPNVVVVHDVVEDEGLPCVVMEYVRSRTLSDVLKKDGPITPREAARIGRGMVAALRAAHRAGVLHRDVKPANVLLGLEDPEEDGNWPGGRVVLTDFGIASASGTSTLTRTGELIGSFDYLAPERITGGNPGPASDLWALGATLYQAVEGVAPFHRDTPIETAYAIASEPVATPRNAGPLVALIESLLAKEPERRMSAEQVERLLVSSVETVVARGTGPADPAGADSARRRSTPSWAARDAGPDAAEVLVDGDPEDPEYAEADAPPAGDDVRDAAPPSARVPRQGGEPGLTSATVIALSELPESHPDGAARADAPGQRGPGRRPPAEDTERPARRRRRAPLVFGAVLVVAAIVAGGAFAARHYGIGPAHPGGDGPPSPTPKPSASAPPLPAGYHLDHDPGGFTMAVPDGWTRQPKPEGEVDFIAPGGLTGLKVSILDFAGPTPLQHWLDLQKILKSDDQQYNLLRMNATTVTIAGTTYPAAIWEWTWQGRAREYHAIDLGFGNEGATQYAVYLSAPHLEWAKQLPAFEEAQETFRPSA